MFQRCVRSIKRKKEKEERKTKYKQEYTTCTPFVTTSPIENPHPCLDYDRTCESLYAMRRTKFFAVISRWNIEEGGGDGRNIFIARTGAMHDRAAGSLTIITGFLSTIGRGAIFHCAYLG